MSSGEGVVYYLKHNSADLRVLDMIIVSEIDGLEAYKNIIEFHPGQKALIISGFSKVERVKGAQRFGAGAYVKKPFLLEKRGLPVKNKLAKLRLKPTSWWTKYHITLGKSILVPPNLLRSALARLTQIKMRSQQYNKSNMQLTTIM